MKYIDLHTILPDGVRAGKFSIVHRKLTEKKVRQYKVRADCLGKTWLAQGLKWNFPYVVLQEMTHSQDLEDRRNDVWMSDTPMERITNQIFLDNAHGRVLVAGLGISLVIQPLLFDERVSHITILEIDKDLIEMMSPYVKNPKVEIIQADATEFVKTYTDAKFNTVWLDIWKGITTDNYPKMILLEKEYRKIMVSKKTDPERFIGSWSKAQIKKEALEERAHKKWCDAMFGGTKRLQKAFNEEFSDSLKSLETMKEAGKKAGFNV
jgi:hypothetical protein